MMVLRNGDIIYDSIRGGRTLEHSLRRLAFQERLDQRMQQIRLRYDGGMCGGRHHCETRGRQRLAHVAMPPPPSSRNIATECSSVVTSASPAMISTGVFIALTSFSHCMGSCSIAISFLTSAGKPSGLGASFRYSFANGIPRNMSTVIFGMNAVNSGCHPRASYATDAATSLLTFAG